MTPKAKLSADCTFVFDRSDLDKICAIYPKGHAKYPEGKKVTKREEMEQNVFMRDDIAMVNKKVGNEIKQTCAFAYSDGSVKWNGTKDYFTLEEQDEIRAIAWRMFEISKEFKPMLKMLHSI